MTFTKRLRRRLDRSEADQCADDYGELLVAVQPLMFDRAGDAQVVISEGTVVCGAARS